MLCVVFFFFQAEDGIRDLTVTGVQTCALPILLRLDIDDRKAAALGLSYTDINSVLSSAMGGTYVNDFLNNERVKRVYIQGDAPHRMLPQDIAKWKIGRAHV